MVEYGTYVKHLKVEVYCIEFRLCVHPNVNDTKTFSFSRADNIGEFKYLSNKVCSLGMALDKQQKSFFKSFSLSCILKYRKTDYLDLSKIIRT